MALIYNVSNRVKTSLSIVQSLLDNSTIIQKKRIAVKMIGSHQGPSLPMTMTMSAGNAAKKTNTWNLIKGIDR